jgi:hypothetical protein
MSCRFRLRSLMFGIRTDRVDVVWEITGRGKSQ